MTTNTLEDEWSPDWAVHPGEHLAEYIALHGMTQAEAARRADMTPKLVNTIIKGENPVSVDSAVKLERVFGLKAIVWLRLQALWDLHQQRLHAAALTEANTTWMTRFPLKDLTARGVLPDVRDKGRVFHSLLAFLQIGSPAGFEARFKALGVRHRQSSAYKTSDYHIAAWLMLGERKARSQDLPAFDAAAFEAAVSEIRGLTTQSPADFQPQMMTLCRSAGVALVLEPEIRKTSLFGSTRWLDDRTPVIQMSLRMKRNDHFWWTFFHEAGHVLLHRGETFVDETGDNRDRKEQEANDFATEALVGRARFNAFTGTRPRSTADVRAFADKIGIHPGIVVGMMQHAKMLPYSHLNSLKVRFEWAEKT